MYDMIILGGGAARLGEIQSHEELFAKLYDRLPKELILTRELMLSSLWRSSEHWEIEAREALPRAKTREAICGSWFLALVSDMVVS